MLMLSSIFLLLSNAINSQREASILNSRIAIVTLMYPIWFLYNQTIYLFLNPGIALFNGLFYINSYTVTFCFFLFNLSVCILCLTGFLHIRVYPSVSYKSYNEFTNEYKAKFMHFYEKTSWYIHSLWYHKNYIEESFRWPSSNSLRPELLEKPYSHNTNLLNLDAIPYRLAEVYGVRYNDGVNRENTMVYVSEVQQEMPSISEANAIAQDKLKANQMYNITEYPLIIVFVITGSVFLMSSSDLLSVFLSVELQSYGLYLLSSSFRNSETATGGGLTYFLLGGLSSTFILLGASFIYANCGNTLLENLYIISDLTPSVHQQTMINNGNSVVHGETLEGRYDMWYNSYYLHLSLVMAGVGFLFKVSAAPFHFWSPDVYDAIPTVVTTFVAIIAKISIFIFLLDLVYYTSKTLQSVNFNWTIILLISSFLSLIIGSVLGLTQHRIKRLYAYSTISHVGFILLALAVCSVESIQSYFFYIMQYSLSNLNAFFLLLVIGYTLTSYEVTPHNDAFSGYKTPQIKDNSVINAVAHEPSAITETNEELLDKDNSPLQLIKQLKGYSSVNPMIAVSLIVTLFSFIGVPPLLGFFAKQMVLSAALDKGYFFVVLIAILTSVISAVYYLSVVKNIFFDTVTSKPLGQDRDQRSNKSGKANTTETNSYTSKGFLTHFFFIISLKHSTRYIGDFPIYEVDSDTRNALTLWDTSFNIDDIILTKGNRHKFGNEFAKDYQFSAYSIEYKTQPTGPLNILISFLSLLILLFMFTPVEWLNLSSILSLSLFYF